MELSIITTSYKNPDLTKVCIDSIRRNCSLVSYEIIVADSATEEDTELMMREDFPDVKFIPSRENIGFSGTVNKGLEIAQGRYILILNGDIIVKKDSIEKLLEYIKENPDVGIVAPKLLNFNGMLQYSCFKFYTPFTIIYRRTFLGKLWFAKKHLDAFLMRDFDHAAAKETDWIMGSALLTTKKAVSKVGSMDARFRLYMEDTDWCRRFWENGYKVVYFPEAQMHHYHGRGSAGKSVLKSLLSNRLTWVHIVSAIKYFLKYSGKSLPSHQ